MSNRKVLGFFIVFCIIFQNVSSTFLLLKTIKNGFQKTKCSIHQIGSKIISHDHRHGDPCEPVDPITYQNLDQPDAQFPEKQQPGLNNENESEQVGVGGKQQTKLQDGSPYNERPQHLNGHSYGPTNNQLELNQNVGSAQDQFSQYTASSDPFTPELQYKPTANEDNLDNGQHFVSQVQYPQESGTTEISQTPPAIDIRLGSPEDKDISSSSTVSSTSTSTITSTSTSVHDYATVPNEGSRNIGTAKPNGFDNTKHGVYAPINVHFGKK